MKDKIINVLKNTSYPIRARYIARSLGVDRTSVNRILYAYINNPFVRNDDFEWSLKNAHQQTKPEQHWAINGLNRDWNDLRDYILDMNTKDQDLFDQRIVNFNFVNCNMKSSTF